MVDMPTTIRKITHFPIDLWAEAQDFRWSRKLGTEADTVRNLVAAGLHYYELMKDEGFQKAEAAALERLQQHAK